MRESAIKFASTIIAAASADSASTTAHLCFLVFNIIQLRYLIRINLQQTKSKCVDFTTFRQRFAQGKLKLKSLCICSCALCYDNARSGYVGRTRVQRVKHETKVEYFKHFCDVLSTITRMIYRNLKYIDEFFYFFYNIIRY